jgi:hypothetical protein
MKLTISSFVVAFNTKKAHNLSVADAISIRASSSPPNPHYINNPKNRPIQGQGIRQAFFSWSF